MLDVEGAFLNGRFSNGERILLKVPEPFRKWYTSYVLLWLMRTMYGTIHVAIQFWRMACNALGYMGYERCKADPCLFFDWEGGALSVILLWVDDCLLTGPKDKVIKAKTKFMRLFERVCGLCDRTRKRVVEDDSNNPATEV